MWEPTRAAEDNKSGAPEYPSRQDGVLPSRLRAAFLLPPARPLISALD